MNETNIYTEGKKPKYSGGSSGCEVDITWYLPPRFRWKFRGQKVKGLNLGGLKFRGGLIFSSFLTKRFC